jgi:hypothetical protein
MIRTQIQLTERQAQGLKRLAAKQKISVAEVIRRSVDRTLMSQRMPDEQELRRRAIEAAGSFNSGKNNIAREHDDYLVEAYLE